MQFGLFLVGLLPLIAFVIVDTFAGLKTGLIVAMVIGFVETIYEWINLGHFEPTSLTSTGLIVVTGLISLRMQSARLFKLQPVMVEVLMAGYLAYYQALGDPLLVKLMEEVPAAVPSGIDPQLLKQLFAVVSRDLVVLLLVHAALVGYAALRLSNWAWVIIKGILIWPLLIIDVLVETLRLVP